MRAAIVAVKTHGAESQASKGRHRELTGVLLEITNPRARLSRTETKGKLFSCLGELCWHLAESDDIHFISYYIPNFPAYVKESPDSSAYGPRMFKRNGTNQVKNIIDQLRSKPNSRRAVIQIFDAMDLERNLEGNLNEIPCTCTLQFLARHDKLHLITNMRSNDIVRGLPHDVFSFTMLQEIIARTLSLELGSYKHFVGSLHYYCHDLSETEEYLNEQYQPTGIYMPPMPKGDPWNAIQRLKCEERKLRLCGVSGFHSPVDLDPYWSDLINLLYIYRCSRDKKSERIASIRSTMTSKIYDTYITRKLIDSEILRKKRGNAPLERM